jgi:two-component system, LytTR family, response regulator
LHHWVPKYPGGAGKPREEPALGVIQSGAGKRIPCSKNIRYLCAMKVIIIEDEELAVETLQRQLRKLDTPIEVVATFDSVKTTVEWIQHHPPPDLAFFDIQLADGLSFGIFEQVKVTFPVIFVTAYDAYALRAFKVNSIDYLLKPVETDALKNALDKLSMLQKSTEATQSSVDLRVIQQMLTRTTPRYKTRFLVKIGDKLAGFTTEEVEYFYGENKIVWMRLKNGRKYVVDYTLDDLEDLLDPVSFFRLNRKYIATFESIDETIAYTNSRLKVKLLHPPDTEDILISREKAEEFRVWLGK